MLTIGEFSHVTRLSLKALRLYHEAGILIPEEVDARTGYRKYGNESIARARSVSVLKELGFSVKEMSEILASCADDGELAGFLEKRLLAVEKELARVTRVRNSIAYLIESEKQQTMKTDMRIEIRKIPTQTIVGIRYRGKYDECGEYFAWEYRAVGRYVTGVPFCLYHEPAEEDGDADIEACVSVRKAVSAGGMDCRVLEERDCACALWKGSYDGIGEAYRQVFEFIGENGYEAAGPIQEVYFKGPGMIIPRSPKRYLTEVRVPVRKKFT